MVSWSERLAYALSPRRVIGRESLDREASSLGTTRERSFPRRAGPRAGQHEAARRG